ncbi:ileal sodium/bile acid cotransporter-like [Condylostylus longicornis]|uniref:ileal sodium/bile acid cotransporter-like n=1 Tax=Condylostylus longicornis TaxID=2530218 RepID=UPI00244DE3EF|nr:ileal sodium/bile acid cotransporter-like [Condylostylus longicornis]
MKQNYYIIIFLILSLEYSKQVLGKYKNESPSDKNWSIRFNETAPFSVNMDNESKLFLKINIFSDLLKNLKIQFHCENQLICDSLDEVTITNGTEWEGFILIKGIFMGRSKLYAEIKLPNNTIQISNEYQNIVVVKKVGIVDHIFTISLGIMVSVIFVSFGAALDMNSLKEILIKPIGPTIGFCCQFILMPILSYTIGYILFSENTNMWLGLFFSGVTPGGGASNMWTLILKGNVNLSIVMTTISNLAAFAMMPFWIFTLGRTIFERGDLGVPYERIGTLSISLIIPLFIGLAIQKFHPKLANVLIRLLKPISIIILIFIISFAIITNLYLFKLFSWRIIIAGMGLPWFGYILSYTAAWLFKQNKSDCLTISIETGLQNTGVAIFLLRFSLQQPEADLTSIVPVSVSIMTKVPLLTLYFIQKSFCLDEDKKVKKNKLDQSKNLNEEEHIMPGTK